MSEAKTVTTGTTPDGVQVEVHHQPRRLDDVVLIDGVRAKVLSVNVYRDGGTTRYTTDLGTLTFPRRLNSPDRAPRWTAAERGGKG